MEETCITNYVSLCGEMAETPTFSHESRGERYYRFPLAVSRLSGAVDTLPILARSELLDELEITGEPKLAVAGELRSFNNKSGVGPKLILTVFARSLRFGTGEDENVIRLTGTLCKAPTHRQTPMGREISDLMLAVNRRYGRSDYLPCIAWGAKARETALWPVGTTARLTGRIQSRAYTKTIDGVSVEKTAFEVSVIDIEKA